MICEIVCVGTELLTGNTINTNASYIAKKMMGLGIDMYHQVVVGDNPKRLTDAILTAINRSDLVITSGGLGPTYDDLT
ncbi:MAG: molybdopterin-binding protein, partial [Oscillospiraceae bacterium]